MFVPSTGASLEKPLQILQIVQDQDKKITCCISVGVLQNAEKISTIHVKNAYQEAAPKFVWQYFSNSLLQQDILRFRVFLLELYAWKLVSNLLASEVFCTLARSVQQTKLLDSF